MYEKLKARLGIMKETNIKPNFAQLAKEEGCDYRTVKKYYQGYEGKPKNRSKGSKLDAIHDDIKNRLAIHRVTIRGVYEYYLDQGFDVGSYSNFRKYVLKHKLKSKVVISGHPRFETNEGHQAQADWKEDFTMTSRNGEVFSFSIFNLELSYSRYNALVYSKSREQDALHRCLISALHKFGGVPKEILFDNMTTAATITKSGKRVNRSLQRFATDFNFKVRLCGPRRSFTKGKVEARNKILDWLRPYNERFEDENELIEIIARINKKMNEYITQATGVSPYYRVQKEIEYLNPLPPLSIQENYQSSRKYTVGKDSLVYYKGNRYSVDPSYIGHQVGLEVLDDRIYIYYNEKLLSVHEEVKGHKQIQYRSEDYKRLLTSYYDDEEELDQAVQQNLEKLRLITGG